MAIRSMRSVSDVPGGQAERGSNSQLASGQAEHFAFWKGRAATERSRGAESVYGVAVHSNTEFALVRYEGGDALVTATPTPTSTAAPAATCPPAPLTGTCRTAGKASLTIKNSADDNQDKLKWKWSQGEATTLADFGDPTSSTSYTLCAYDALGFAFSATVPGGGTCGGKPCWRPSGTTGFKYRDRERTNAGVQVVALKAGEAGRARISLKGGTHS